MLLGAVITNYWSFYVLSLNFKISSMLCLSQIKRLLNLISSGILRFVFTQPLGDLVHLPLQANISLIIIHKSCSE